MTVVFLNFSDGANLHRSVRFSSRAVRVFPALSLDARGPHLIRDFFSYGFLTKLRAGPYGSLACVASISVRFRSKERKPKVPFLGLFLCAINV